MFHNYPLTWLFIIATLCVDAAVLFTSSWGSVLVEDAGPRFYLYNFGLPAQISTLAIWAVMGRGQVLVRATCVTFAFASLLLLTWVVEAPDWSSDHTICNFIQFFTVLCFTALLRWCGINKRVGAASRGPIQFSLIEMFGWMMIVALWAFALRFTSAEIFDVYLVVWIVVASLSSVLLVPIMYTPLSTVPRLLWLTGLYLFALLAYAVGRRYMEGPMPLWALSMAIMQITYISAWWSVMRMDEVMQERRAVTADAREKLAVFDPREEEKK
jgi:hypothetical protein